MSQYLGDISAYALAVSQGYTGTEEEYAELMASYATVGQTAVTAAQTATTKASEAATSATTATNKASEATTAATTATTKAGEASTSASTATSAKDTAVSASQTATTKATEATTAAATAVSAKDDAVSANTAAQSAKTAAQTAQTGAETAAASVQASATQIQTNAEDISELKEDLTNKTADVLDNSDLLGNNINDLPLEDGSISLTTGEDSPNATRARSKGFLECLPNTKYTINYGLTGLAGYMWVIGYDSNKDIITDSNVGGYTSVVGYINNSMGEGTFTTSATTKYMRWYNTANIDRSTFVKMYCHNNWKNDMDIARDIHSKDRFFLSAPYVPTITTLRTNKIIVSFENATSLYIIRESGGSNYKRIDIPANTVYTLEANDVLIWDLDNNTISILGNTDPRGNNILLLNNYNGRPQQGEFLQYVPQYRPITKYNNTGCSAYHKVSDVTTTQGMTVVKDAIWGFNGSDDLHEHFYNIVVRDKDTFEQITTIRHNLGHCASADYNAKTDTVMVCNGNLTLDTPPEFYLIKNASSYNQSSGETLAYNDSTKVVKVDVHELGDYSLIGCFGENEHIAYFAITNTNATTKIYKCLLGMGTVDYSENGYGAFVSGCAADEYNGTVLVLNEYTGINLDVFQGMCFHNGDIYMLLDNSGRKEAYIGKINLVNDSTYEVVETRMIIEEYDTSGNKVYYEPEGLCVLDGMYWLFNLALTGQNRLVIVPINNRQGGKGTAGTAVTFPFPCNSTPNVQITSLTNKSIYISEVSNTGFTVNATDGTTGGVFTWECDIT